MDIEMVKPLTVGGWLLDSFLVQADHDVPSDMILGMLRSRFPDYCGIGPATVDFVRVNGDKAIWRVSRVASPPDLG